MNLDSSSPVSRHSGLEPCRLLCWEEWEPGWSLLCGPGGFWTFDAPANCIPLPPMLKRQPLILLKSFTTQDTEEYRGTSNTPSCRRMCVSFHDEESDCSSATSVSRKIRQRFAENFWAG